MDKGIPFEPKFGDIYYTYGGDNWNVLEVSWTDDAYDYIHKTCGCVFRTKEEALEYLPVKYKMLTGEEWIAKG